MLSWSLKYLLAPTVVGIGNFILVSWLLERTIICFYHSKLCGLYPLAEENIFFILSFPTVRFASVFSTVSKALFFNALLWGLATLAMILFWTKSSDMWTKFRQYFKPRKNDF